VRRREGREAFRAGRGRAPPHPARLGEDGRQAQGNGARTRLRSEL